MNPTFGKASRLVGGADADLLIDETLIEIKAVKNLDLKRDHFNQLMGYVILNRLGCIGDNIKPKPKITKVAIYFARYGHLEVFDLNKLINSDTFPNFVKWFNERTNNNIIKTKRDCTTSRWR